MKFIPSSALLILLAFPVTLFCQSVDGKLPRCEVLQTGLILNNPPFQQCHASTIIELKNGFLLAAFFGGSFESAPDVRIWGSVRHDKQWADPYVLADGRISDSIIYPCWNPVLFKSAAGRIYLFYKVGKNPREWFGMMRCSTDEGKTWSEPSRLPVGVLGPIKNKPVELPDGRLLCPSSTESLTDWKVQMEIFDPTANTWTISRVDQENPFQVIQPTILKVKDSTYRILCRSKRNSIITSISADNGRSWSKLSAIGLPNPNSGIDAVTLQDGSHLLVYNPLFSGREWVNGRNQLNLAWSADGSTWTDILILEKEETGEFSYPAIIQSSDNLIHITYTHNRNQIKYWKLKVGGS